MRYRRLKVVVTLLAALCLVPAASAAAIEAKPRFAPGPNESLPVSFAGSGSTKAFFEVEPQVGIYWGLPTNRLFECSGGSAVSGTLTAGFKISSFRLELKRCELVKGGIGEEFHTPGASAGTVVLAPLEAVRSEYINKAGGEVGLYLNIPTGKPEDKIYSGATERYRIGGHLIIGISPLNVSTSFFTLALHQHSALQEFTTIEERFAGGTLRKQSLQVAKAGSETYSATGLEAGELSLFSSKHLTLEA